MFFFTGRYKSYIRPNINKKLLIEVEMKYKAVEYFLEKNLG